MAEAKHSRHFYAVFRLLHNNQSETFQSEWLGNELCQLLYITDKEHCKSHGYILKNTKINCEISYGSSYSLYDTSARECRRMDYHDKQQERYVCKKLLEITVALLH